MYNESNTNTNNSSVNNQPQDEQLNNIPILTPNDNVNVVLSPVPDASARNDVYHWNYSQHLENEKQGGTKRRREKNRNGKGLKILAAVMSAMMIFSFASLAWLVIDNYNLQNQLNVTPPIISNQAAVDQTSLQSSTSTSGEVLTTPEVIQKVKPSVVCVESSIRTQYFGRTYTSVGIGTGFIITEDGYIVTNYHVIEGAYEITITLGTGESYTAEVIGYDEIGDIAVLKINATGLPYVELGDSDALIEGEDVVVIGTPAGSEFAGTNTKGIVSAINRNVEVQSSNGYTTKTMTVIQIDAAINPGNSGGPVINDRGQVIGIATMKLSNGYEGIGFALPINGVIPTVNDIIQNGTKTDNDSTTSATSATRIGIEGYTVDANESSTKMIPQGVKITSIFSDGPCYGSGIQVGDIIVAFNGYTVTSLDDVNTQKAKYKAGDKVKLTVYRNGDSLEFEIVLAANTNN